MCTFAVTSYAEVWIEIGVAANVKAVGYVTSYAEVWIEIGTGFAPDRLGDVTSYAEVWIEINTVLIRPNYTLSPPTRRCGLK